MKRILLAVVFSSFTSVIFAQIKHPIDKELDLCLEEATPTAAAIECMTKASEAWDKELNKYYQLYLAALNEENKETLKEAQRQWIVYRDKEFSLIDAHYYNQLEGTMWRPIAAGTRMRIVKSRALELQNYYEELEIEE
ncbi:lysozyme inhibitor LprI family protein [Fulvivirga imtechensis]|nr:lysozyme inhibitor LprI family protein [Fulvivirga imtechensis]